MIGGKAGGSVATTCGVMGAVTDGDVVSGLVAVTCGVVGAVTDGDVVSGLVGGTVCGAAAVGLVALTVGAGAWSNTAANCFGCHTKKYQVAAAAATLAITPTLVTTTAVSAAVGLARIRAPGSGSTR